MKLGEGITSPGWYAAFNTMVMCLEFINYNGLSEEFQKWKIEKWPDKAKGIKECYLAKGWEFPLGGDSIW